MYSDCTDDREGMELITVTSWVVCRDNKFKLANHRLTPFMSLAKQFATEREANLFCDDGDIPVKYSRQVWSIR